MSQKFDLSGVHRFWEIVDIYKQAKEPDEEAWKELFDTPGYDILTEVEFHEEYLRGIFESSFKRDEVDISNEKDSIERQMIEHFREVRDNREQLNSFLSKIFSEDHYDKALDFALEWLPFDDREPYPPVSFLIFQKDARGYIPIVFDLQLAFELDDDFPEFLAHEMHHFYRNLKVSFDPNIEDKEIVWVLNQIHMEGMADQINRDLIFKENPVMGIEYQNRYIEIYDHAERYIKDLDEDISRYREDPERYGGKIKDTLPLSGRPIGSFMVESIIRSGFRKELIERYDDPFCFFELYNKIAHRQEITTFSEESITTIKELRSRYL